MSKKHYVAIAKKVNEVMWMEKSDPATVTALMIALAGVFRDDNPLFDTQRFYSACTNNPSTR